MHGAGARGASVGSRRGGRSTEEAPYAGRRSHRGVGEGRVGAAVHRVKEEGRLDDVRCVAGCGIREDSLMGPGLSSRDSSFCKVG